MNNILAILLCVFLYTHASAENIRIRTVVIGIVGSDCWVYHSTFWADNNTPDTWADDRYLGFHDVLDCEDWQHLQDKPDEPMVPESAECLKLNEKGEYEIPPGTKLITYTQYKALLEQNNIELGKTEATKLIDPNLNKKIELQFIKKD